MKKKNIYFALTSIGIAILASVFAYQYLSHFFIEFNIQAETQNKVNIRFSYNLYLQCFLFLFTFISLPFLFSLFAVKWKIDKNNWWKPIVILEFFGLILAYITTPPDLISTLILISVWQLSIIVNTITLIWITRENRSKI